MEKIDRKIYKDDYAEANRELINKCIIKLDEIVEWINEREKNNRLTMQEVIRLMDEDVRQARGGREHDPARKSKYIRKVKRTMEQIS